MPIVFDNVGFNTRNINDERTLKLNAKIDERMMKLDEQGYCIEDCFSDDELEQLGIRMR